MTDPRRVDHYLDEALYGPDGFFTTGRGAGRRADFVTSPELGPLFGAVVARALDAEWDRLGRPDPFTVVEGGAGRGALARAVLAAPPACAAALQYVCVERSPALAAMATEAGLEVAADLPPGPVTGVVLANELLDNLPFRLLERTAEGWCEVHVDAAGGQVLLPGPEPPVPVTAGPGARVPFQEQAAAWVAAAMALLERGRVVIVDYADATTSLATRPWREWVRTYRRHGRGGDPMADPGSQDVTCEVAVDQLTAAVRAADSDRSQAEWLRAHGIDDLVAAARARWHERAAVGDLDALAARSRVGEGDALLDPTGLGAFRVLEWVVG